LNNRRKGKKRKKTAIGGKEKAQSEADVLL
jgi:hypothetical protein